eukprot:10262411-Alexandrium_andersonii.AAC.1
MCIRDSAGGHPARGRRHAAGFGGAPRMRGARARSVPPGAATAATRAPRRHRPVSYTHLRAHETSAHL